MLAATALAVAGCSTELGGTALPGGPDAGDRELIVGYFDARNAAAEQGPAALQQFLDDTQHPDSRSGPCSLEGIVLVTDPALTTLRADPDWAPPDEVDPPRGTTYVVAASVSVERDEVELATQIGSQHVVVLDGAAYGFAPCPA